MLRCILGVVWLFAAGPLLAQELSIMPAAPTPLDTVRLRWAHVGCTDPDSVQVSQQANAITASANRIFLIDCGTVLGYFDEYTLGRFPSGEYDARLIGNPPPGTLVARNSRSRSTAPRPRSRWSACVSEFFPRNAPTRPA